MPRTAEASFGLVGMDSLGLEPRNVGILAILTLVGPVLFVLLA